MDRFIKIGATGQRLSSDATEWVAVLDTKQNLVFSIEETKRMDFADAKTHCAALRLLGYEDWRLPTVEELFLLADRTRHEPAIDTAFFPDCRSDWYWTGTVSSRYLGACAWVVHFDSGDSGWLSQSSEYHVRAVRAGQ